MHQKTFKLVATGMFTAILTILSQLSIPMPSGVPLTLQTFAVALTGIILGYKLGTLSTLIYLLLGMAGVPVFAGFRGGFSSLLGFTGGFLWGFLPLVFFSGIACNRRPLKRYLLMAVGLLFCHLLGTLQYSFIAKLDFIPAFALVSLPYLLKDTVLLVIAGVVGTLIHKQLLRSGFLNEDGRLL